MAAFKVTTVSAFRKEGFTAKLIESGIKLFGEGDKAEKKGFLRFDDDMPPLTYNLFNRKTGKSIFETVPKGDVQTKNYGIGQIIEFMFEKKSIDSFIDLEPGQEAWWFGKIDHPEKNVAVGLNFTFEAHTPKIKDDAGNLSDGFTNFTLVKVEADGAKVPESSPKEQAKEKTPVVQDLTAWKEFLKPLLTTMPLDEKGINKAVNAAAKTSGKTPEQLGLGDRKKSLTVLTEQNFIELNEDGDYILKA